MGNDGDKGEEMKIWEEHDIEGNENVKKTGRKERYQVYRKKRKTRG